VDRSAGSCIALLQHLLVIKDFLPALSGAARYHAALARRYPEPMSVSTVAGRQATRYDAAEDYKIERQSFGYDAADGFVSRMRWQTWLSGRCKGRVQVLHCGGIGVTGRVVRHTHKRVRIPYVVYVSASELNRAREKVKSGSFARRSVRLVLGDAAGIVATTDYVAILTRELMQEIGITQPPPVAAPGMGADPLLFGPGRDTGTLRQRWGIRRAPIILTVARLVPHKGQDTGIEAIALLRDEFPNLRYVLVGEGSDEARLRNIAADMNVMDRVGFAGPMRDDELPEAYATSTIYLDASRAAPGATVAGNGISLIEAQATALPVVTSDAGGVRSFVREGESGIIVEPASARSMADALAALLRDAEKRSEMGMAGREAVETRMNWSRVTHDTARFVQECVANG
jgi:glycosyltransferase involved in cell wall biosynthesis